MDNISTINSINTALADAVDQCWNQVTDLEERGGVILHHPDRDEYVFIALRNSNTGTAIAPVLFTADRDEYAEIIIPLFKLGWKSYASFHTHPQFSPYPSSIDMNDLFPGFYINYIYSGTQDKLIKYTWVDPQQLECGLIPEIINYNE